MFSSHEKTDAAYTRENFLIAFIRAIGFFLFYYTVRTVVFTSASIFFTIKYQDIDDALAVYMESANALSFFCAILIILGLCAFFKYQKKSVSTSLYIGNPDISTIALCFIAGISLNFSTTYIMSFLPKSLLESYSETSSGLSEGSLLWYILAAVIMAPILEELIFRSMMISRLSSATGNTLAVILSSAVFGAVHGHIVWSTYAFLLGLLLGFVFVRTRSVTVSIAMHLGFNLVSLISRIDTFPETLINILSLCYLVSLPISALLILIFIKKTSSYASKTPIGIEEIL